MGEATAWLAQWPQAWPLLGMAGLLVLSVVGAPWLRPAPSNPFDRERTLRDKWGFFAWQHPFWAGVVIWVLVPSLVILIAWPIVPMIWQSQWITVAETEVVDISRKTWEAALIFLRPS